MKPQPADPKEGSHDPTWRLLLEIPLPYSEDLSANASFRQLIEMVHSLGLKQAQIERLQADILQAVNKFTAIRSGQIEPELSAVVRLFVKKRERQGAHLRKKRLGSGSTQYQRASFQKTGEWIQEVGGWGYFLSERWLNQAGTGFGPPTYLVELFLYREGM